jgi:hypothetical protein
MSDFTPYRHDKQEMKKDFPNKQGHAGFCAGGDAAAAPGASVALKLVVEPVCDKIKSAFADKAPEKGK